MVEGGVKYPAANLVFKAKLNCVFSMEAEIDAQGVSTRVMAAMATFGLMVFVGDVSGKLTADLGVPCLAYLSLIRRRKVDNECRVIISPEAIPYTS